MKIDFPSNPSTNDEFTFLSRTWKYNGTSWELKPQPLTYNSIVNAIGYTPVSNYDAIVNNNLSVGGDVTIAKSLSCSGSISFTGGGQTALQTANIANSTTQNGIFTKAVVLSANIANSTTVNAIIDIARISIANIISSTIDTVNITYANITSANIVSSNIGQLNVTNAMIHTLVVDSGNLMIGTGLTRIDGANSNTYIFYANTVELLRMTSFDGDNVSIGIATTGGVNTVLQIGSRVYDDNALDYVKANLTNAVYIISQQNTSDTLLNDIKPVLILGRQGYGTKANGSAAIIGLSRYENAGANSRTRLDIVLANTSLAKDFNRTLNTAFTIYSTGNVAVGLTQAGLGIGNGVLDIRGSVSGYHQATLARAPDDTNMELRAVNGIGGVNGGDVLSSFGAYYKTNNYESAVIKFIKGTDSTDSNIAFFTKSTERARITGTGNFLIGTSTDSIYKLDVSGTIRASSFVAGTTTLTGATPVLADTQSTPRYIGFIDSGSTSLTNLLVKSDFTYNPGTSTFSATYISGSTLTSTIATGTPPLTVASTTKVTNLNASFLEGFSTNAGAVVNTIPVRGTGGSLTIGPLTATTISGSTGTFSGAITGTGYSGGPISGTTGTFSGAVSASSYGAVSATTGTFSGAVTASSVTAKLLSRNLIQGSVTSLTINSDTYDLFEVDGQTAAFTISVDQGTPSEGQKIIIRVRDNGTTRTITFTGNSTGVTKGFRSIGISTLTVSGTNWTYPTVASKWGYFGCIYNAGDSVWDIVAFTEQT